MEKLHKGLFIVWNVVYWSVIVFGTVCNTFLQRYWRTGHYSVISKVLIAVRNLIIIAAVLGAIAGAGTLAIYLWKKEEGINYGKAMILLMGNIYGLVVLVLLLGYGLFNLPLTIAS